MEIFSPHTLTLEESQSVATEWSAAAKEMDISNETLTEYMNRFLQTYREVLERYFSTIRELIPAYTNYPYQTTIVRLGPNGMVICHKDSEVSSIRIMRFDEFDPPLESPNVLEITKRLGALFYTFDFRIRSYDLGEAEVEGTRWALRDALEVFWRVIDEKSFADICIEILKAENIEFNIETSESSARQFDGVGKILLEEPAGFRRFETWGFEFKQYPAHRVSASYLREVEAAIEGDLAQIDNVCLVSSADLTSIANSIVVRNPRIRVWDRPILNALVHKHFGILEAHFSLYSSAVNNISQEFEKKEVHLISRLREFRNKLENCPVGLKHFSKYEDIGTEIIEYLFPEALGSPRKQKETSNGTQRRDVLFRNNRSSRFFIRAAERLNADFIIVDFKNYKDPITPGVVDDAVRYANKALGRLIIVVSRKGAVDTFPVHQSRIYRDEDILVLVISDLELLEMITRSERGESPEDVLEDLMDEFLVRY